MLRRGGKAGRAARAGRGQDRGGGGGGGGTAAAPTAAGRGEGRGPEQPQDRHAGVRAILKRPAFLCGAVEIKIQVLSLIKIAVCSAST
jgi:hypothetical protein